MSARHLNLFRIKSPLKVNKKKMSRVKTVEVLPINLILHLLTYNDSRRLAWLCLTSSKWLFREIKNNQWCMCNIPYVLHAHKQWNPIPREKIDWIVHDLTIDYDIYKYKIKELRGLKNAFPDLEIIRELGEVDCDRIEDLIDWQKIFPNITLVTLLRETGRLFDIIHYKDGVCCADKGWYADGPLHFTRSFNEGKRDGTCKTWHPNGEKKIIEFYNMGLLVGTKKWWFDNGQPRYEEPYDENGVKIGIWKEWDKSGKLLSERKQPKNKCWVEDGVVYREEYVEDVDGNSFVIMSEKPLY